MSTEEGPDAKRARLPLPPPPPVPPPTAAKNGGMSALLTQMAARGVAKQPTGMGFPFMGMGCMGPMGQTGPLMSMPMGQPMGQPMGPMGQMGLRPTMGMGQLPLGTMTPGPALAPGQPVSLAKATAHITPASSKPLGKQIAVEFVQASKERQAEMLRDPAVAKAILQTLEGAKKAEEAEKSTLWTGVLTLARNGAKKLPARVSLHHGKVADIEVAVRSAANNSARVLDIKHRVPFDEVARRIQGGSVLSLDPIAVTDQASFDEYIKYFKTKSRAGVSRLENGMSLYLLPAGESPEVLKALYELNTHIPRSGSLLGIIGTADAPKVKEETQAQPPKEHEETREARTEEKDEPKAGEDEGEKISSKELMDLFSNPDLIQLLSDGKS